GGFPLGIRVERELVDRVADARAARDRGRGPERHAGIGRLGSSARQFVPLLQRGLREGRFTGGRERLERELRRNEGTVWNRAPEGRFAAGLPTRQPLLFARLPRNQIVHLQGALSAQGFQRDF